MKKMKQYGKSQMEYLGLTVIATLLIFFVGCTNHIESNMHAIKLSGDVKVFQLAGG